MGGLCVTMSLCRIVITTPVPAISVVRSSCDVSRRGMRANLAFRVLDTGIGSRLVGSPRSIFSTRGNQASTGLAS